MTAGTAADLDDDGALLPPVAARWLSGWRARWTRADVLAVAVGLAGLVPLLVVAWGGGLYADDIRGLALFGPEPLGKVLLWSGGSHVVPGTHLVLWLHARIAGLDYTPVLILVPALRLLATAAVWRMLRTLFGPDWRAVVALAVYVFLPLGVSATAWYVQALTVLPVHLAIAWSITAAVHWQRRRSWGHALAAAAAVAFGLCFAEKAAALFVLLPVFCLLGLGVGQPLRRVRDVFPALRRDAPLLLALALVAVAWVVTYVGSGGDTGRPVGVGQVLALLGRAVWSGILPTIAGGPWDWHPGGVLYESAPYYAVASAPMAASALGLLLVLLGLAAAARNSPRRAVESVVLVLAFLVPMAAMVALARLDQIGYQIAVDLRFWADLTPVLALAVAHAAGGRPAGRARAVAPARAARRGPALTFAAVWLVSMSVSVAGFAGHWHRNPSADFLDAMSASLTGTRTPVPLYDSELPEDVVSPIFRPHTNVSFVVAPLRADAEVGLSAATMSLVGPDGSLLPARWAPRESSPPGPVPRCGWSLRRTTAATAVIAFDRLIPHEAGLSVRLDVLSGQPARLRVEAYDGTRWRPIPRPVGLSRSVAVELPAGLNAAVMRLPIAPLDAVRVTSTGPGVVCLLHADAGVPEPVP